MQTIIQQLHEAGMAFRQSLTPKYCRIKFPVISNDNFSNKIFEFNSISASEGVTERTKKYDSTYDNNVVEIMVTQNILKNTKDITNSLSAPLDGYKRRNALIQFNGRTYAIKEEIENPMGNNGISFICVSTN